MILMTDLEIFCNFAADNVERFAELMVPDSLQPHKKMLKVNLLTRFYFLIYVILIHIRIGVRGTP